MITLKLSAYTHKEIKELLKLCYSAQKVMHKCNMNCEICEIKHLCTDICSATEYCARCLEQGGQK